MFSVVLTYTQLSSIWFNLFHYIVCWFQCNLLLLVNNKTRPMLVKSLFGKTGPIFLSHWQIKQVKYNINILDLYCNCEWFKVTSIIVFAVSERVWMKSVKGTVKRAVSRVSPVFLQVRALTTSQSLKNLVEALFKQFFWLVAQCGDASSAELKSWVYISLKICFDHFE